ncbi:protein jag [Ornithinimicrobium sp. LYQ103]|uniref:Jag family protein n=1 Tax=Ornithinimicrobium sp. LYQ103 TaxID=3378796 RepID=UPI003852BCED
MSTTPETTAETLPPADVEQVPSPAEPGTPLGEDETVQTFEAAGDDVADDAVGETAIESGEPVEDGEDEETVVPAGERAPARTAELVREGEIAADFLEALLDIADLSGDLEVDIEGNRAAVAIVDSEDGVAPRRLVGPGGQVLDALQELTRLAVQAETGERSRLMLDVAGYRDDRRTALVTTARRAIDEVKESGVRQELEAMTAFERKVVHDEVLAAGLHSESEGVEPSRHVVILPAS